MADTSLVSKAVEAGESLLPEYEKPKTAREWLISIALRPALFHDERADAYGAVVEEGIRRILRVRSKAFKSWIASTYYEESGKGASADYLASALIIAEARAGKGPKHPLEVRFARHRGDIWLDLCDERWRSVHITTEGWEVVDSQEAPVLFRRHPHQAAIPVPERGGRVSELLDFLNVRDDDARLLLLAWLVTTPVTTVPRPLLAFHGPQGAAKTVAAKLLRSIVDPSEIPNLDLGRDPGELALALDHHAVPLFDNVTKVAKWQEDRLCCAVTGGGFSKRMLFTDAEDVILKFRRAVIMTGINIPTSAPDLLDRMLLIALERIPQDGRREEAELFADFEAARARIVGGLLDALSGAMRLRASVRLKRLPRMADFGRWGAAASEALGFGQAAFVAAYSKNVGAAVEEALASDPIGEAVIAFADSEGDWTGRPSELYTLLTERHAAEAKASDWPKDAARLSKSLHVLQTSLAEIGVIVSFPSKDGRGKRSIRVRRLPPSPPYRRAGDQTSGESGSSDDEEHGGSHGGKLPSASLLPFEPPSSNIDLTCAVQTPYADAAPQAGSNGSKSPVPEGGTPEAQEPAPNALDDEEVPF